MKIGLYMYDREIELSDESTDLFLEQFDKAKEGMKDLLNKFDDEEVRVALFYMMNLRSFIDDFLEFCTDDISVDEFESMLNNSDFEVELDDDDDEFEIMIDFDDEEE